MYINNSNKTKFKNIAKYNKNNDNKILVDNEKVNKIVNSWGYKLNKSKDGSSVNNNKCKGNK